MLASVFVSFHWPLSLHWRNQATSLKLASKGGKKRLQSRFLIFSSSTYFLILFSMQRRMKNSGWHVWGRSTFLTSQPDFKQIWHFVRWTCWRKSFDRNSSGQKSKCQMVRTVAYRVWGRGSNPNGAKHSSAPPGFLLLIFLHEKIVPDTFNNLVSSSFTNNWAVCSG